METNMKDSSEDISKYEFPFGHPIGITVYFKADGVRNKEDVYYLHNFENDAMIIGDGLPVGKKLAIEYCRLASIGWRQAKRHLDEVIDRNIKNLKQEINTTYSNSAK